MNKQRQLFSVIALTTVVTTGIITIDAKLGNLPLPGQPALAGWGGAFGGVATDIFSEISKRIPTPTGIYLKIDGKEWFLGEYAGPGRDAVVFKDGAWEVKIDGKVVAHGYGETPGWVLEKAQRIWSVPVH